MNNPVLRKELLMRMRLRQMRLGPRVGVVGTIAVLLGVIYYNMIYKWILNDPSSRSGYDAWILVVSIQAGLICLVAPAIAANSITQEKEQQTWEMLIFTRLQPSEIILGKLIARLSTIALMLILFAPIELACWYKSHNEISGQMMLLTYLTLAIMATFYGTFGLFMSWLLRRTIYSIMSSYSFVIGGLLVGTGLVGLMFSNLISDAMVVKCPVMWINPSLMMVESIMPKDNATNVLYLMYGLIAYVVLTLLILWRMTTGFRRFATAD